MTLACQKDSYLQEFETYVISCDPVDGSDCLKSGYVITLADTILFPEGGGQPCDVGSINGITVNNVKRKEKKVLHYVQTPLSIGEKASITLNWTRRFDHMQQHTGQHIITAVAEDKFNFHTTSWNLGESSSFIELDVPCIKAEEISELEQTLNQRIRSCIPVTVDLYPKDCPELSKVRTRLELPEDHDGPVRIISVEGIDKNTCCGTHVKNTSELQVIKLLCVEKGKKNKTNLHFVVGNRVLKYMDECLHREKLLKTLLGSNADSLVEIVQKLLNASKMAHKNSTLTLRELAIMEAKLLKTKTPKPNFFSLHKMHAETDFITIFLKELGDYDVLCFLTVGDGKSGGHFTVFGPEKIVQEYGPKICSILNAKGAGKNGKYQGRFSKISAVPEAEKILKKAIENL